MEKFTLKDFFKNNPQYMVSMIFTGILFIISIIYFLPFVNSTEWVADYSNSVKQTQDTGKFGIFFMGSFFVASIFMTVKRFLATKQKVENS